ncbi:hypothetical protein R8Z50_22490 [Longispora sp. K20-0274]|uniref:hypothetical protein n=1 Tax=Longispora sp. K20-0274 TaxID=3088255 RepID=UPI00399BF60A
MSDNTVADIARLAPQLPDGFKELIDALGTAGWRTECRTTQTARCTWVHVDGYAPPTVDKDGNVVLGETVRGTWSCPADDTYEQRFSGLAAAGQEAQALQPVADLGPVLLRVRTGS